MMSAVSAIHTSTHIVELYCDYVAGLENGSAS
jgi:hypothetical protein